MSVRNGAGPTPRPADICRALLAALEASEGRRRSRKRDQTPDAFGLSVKRDLLRCAVEADPDAENFEAWLLAYPLTCGAPELAGPAFAMARAVYEDWRLSQASDEFRHWLDAGAPSADANARRQDEGKSSLAAVVLAGGRSARMGRSKALLPFGDHPLIAHVVTTLRGLFDEIVIVAAPDQDLPSLGVPVVRDEVAFQGPVGGLCYGLAAVTREAAFVTSCDSVFLSPRVIAHLVAQLPGYDVVVPTWHERLQPLHAVYRTSVLPLLRGQLERRELRPVYLFDKVRTRRVGEDEIRRIDPEGWSFFNMNTPEDYREALDRWRALREPAIATSPVQCVVELYGVARMVAQTNEVRLTIPADACLSHVFAVLAEQLPSLVGRVITEDHTQLVEGYACNVNGRTFVRTPSTRVHAGDHLIILSADAGG